MRGKSNENIKLLGVLQAFVKVFRGDWLAHFGRLLLKCAPPFPNTIPLTSRAIRIALTISGDTGLVPNSKLVTVETPTPAAFASSVCFIFNSARPARHCSGVISMP
jgi:hypothetical protein